MKVTRSCGCENHVIGCIGWGSLIWDPRELPVKGRWFTDGPRLPVEFSRQSQKGHITLALTENAEPVQTLWTELSVSSIDQAAEVLRVREGPTKVAWIGRHPGGSNPTNPIALVIAAWCNERGLDGVVWTALPPKFRETSGIIPTADEVVNHLRQLSGDARIAAERYVRCAPAQVRTKYRLKIEAELGWVNAECNPRAV